MELKIENVDIEQLKAYKNNAKLHTEEQIHSIANSIKEFGFQQPIVVDKNNVIIIGHGRYLAAKELGYSEVPCVRANDLTANQVKALRLVDNKTNESDWDRDLLSAEIEDLPDFDLTEFGFDEFELLMMKNPESQEEEEPSEEPQPSGTTADPKMRIIIIMHGEEEEQTVRDIFNIQGVLKPSYKAENLIKGAEQNDN